MSRRATETFDKHDAEFDLADDIEFLLTSHDIDNSDDGEDDDPDERPVSRMQFYTACDSESSSCPSSPETVILNDYYREERDNVEEFEDLYDTALPDLLPITQCNGLYYEASVIVKNNVLSVSDVNAFNDNHKYPHIYEVMKILMIFLTKFRSQMLQL